ncbi:hypothetical protein Pmani_016105 [Petrolisthes manimaculis]|uniref:Uncharacterized protein n=1 Tax=Petrolisthes manimaculis TaxID=1843537 RepID=A0AAE1U6S9_9EUCA|nr:hypothetical protein Pmani_016105 [Petrolisthes manimaculis]
MDGNPARRHSTTGCTALITTYQTCTTHPYPASITAITSIFPYQSYATATTDHARVPPPSVRPKLTPSA